MQKGILSTLKKIRKTIETPEKWMKGELNNREGAYCVLGAKNHVDGPYEDPTLVALVLSLSPKFSSGSLVEDIINCPNVYCQGIADFNDAETIKHKHVLALLDRTSKNVAAAL